MSLMFPTIFALGIKGLGANTKLGGSFIVMSIIWRRGDSPQHGQISERTHSMAIAMLLPMFCYIFITYYAFTGSRVRVPQLTPANA